MGSYKLSEEAKIDLIRIHQYGIVNFGEEHADRYFNAFFVQFDRIAENPYLFQSVNYIYKEYRRCVLGADSIYYCIQNDTVDIIRIIGRQDYEP